MPIDLKFLSGCAVLAAVICTGGACKGKPRTEASMEVLSGDASGQVLSAPFQSVLPMNDPHASQQLVQGFFELAAGTWRWTAGKFAVVLATPPDAATKGAKLQFRLTVPEVVIAQLNTLTLSAKAGDFALPPQSFDKHGDFLYEREIPASAPPGSRVRIDFSLDKTLPGTTADPRKLGVIATSIGLISK